MIWDEPAHEKVTKGQVMRLLKARAEDFAKSDQSISGTDEYCKEVAALHRALVKTR